MPQLHQGHSSQRLRSGGKYRRGQIADMVSIHVRPPEVPGRLLPGYWESDLIKHADNKSAVGVLVERSTRPVLLCMMADQPTLSVLAAFTTELNRIAALMRQTLTYDQGKEIARHLELAQATNMWVYFYDPISPWPRGSCENTNGLLSQFLPKRSDLSVHSGDALNCLANLINSLPRQTLDWPSPYQAFQWFMGGS